MAFDAHEITTLMYSTYQPSSWPTCPNGANVIWNTISRVMTWADLQSGCESFALGAPYRSDFPYGIDFRNGRFFSMVIGAASMLSNFDN
jgi:hypothetical protein